MGVEALMANVMTVLLRFLLLEIRLESCELVNYCVGTIVRGA